MASANITVTSKTGPGSTVTSQVFSNVLAVNFNIAAQVVTVVDGNNTPHDFDLFGTTTITYTVSSHVGTIAISQ